MLSSPALSIEQRTQLKHAYPQKYSAIPLDHSLTATFLTTLLVKIRRKVPPAAFVFSYPHTCRRQADSLFFLFSQNNMKDHHLCLLQTQRATEVL